MTPEPTSAELARPIALPRRAATLAVVRQESPVLRVVAVVVSLAGLLLTLPLQLLIAAAIKLDSKGPIFFVQERLGLGGEPFWLLKFRTMHPASNRTSEWEDDNSERVTRVGRWLRPLHFDELPQFLNVLLGQMNLVGPRPHPVSNLHLLVERIPDYHERLRVRPGITGLAQVHYGYANGIDEEVEKMIYDLYYVEHRSLSVDLSILLKTVLVLPGIIGGSGSLRGR